jgi:hypothetical protein
VDGSVVRGGDWEGEGRGGEGWGVGSCWKGRWGKVFVEEAAKGWVGCTAVVLQRFQKEEQFDLFVRCWTCLVRQGATK